ncbi:hypothetical protein PR202_ga16810 [Eleusine coracana subsp. coracana]|uniref:Uncharacterized protein n=1 Tax=Eleusine coracana subsp. coracana TaxID=191504 RepID=A0AAV5CP77_ELECO|nr:hypothetical protein PR202_ga16802 [Eleusine coracana subsp. coracana]GJM99687.1 hypothetical protein PR202_ga16810 [Eleusine coracana subsp. coracana]
MLPTTASKGRGAARSAPPLFGPYLRRIVKVRPCSPPAALSIPSRLPPLPLPPADLTYHPAAISTPNITSFYYEFMISLPVLSETKNQWARDDPAFIVILILFLVFATSAYCAAYGESASHAALTITSVVLVHFLFAGILLATLCWFLTNSYLREEPNSHVVEQRVECNCLTYSSHVTVILIGFNPTRYFLSLYFG